MIAPYKSRTLISRMQDSDQCPCVSEWQAWQSVIKFSRQS